MKTKMLFLFIASLMFISTLSAVEKNKGKILSESVLKAINIIENDIKNEAYNDLIKSVVEFAINSDDVAVVLNSKLLPWINEKDKSERLNQLTGIFIAGNIKNQIISGINKDNSFEGLKLTIKIYKQFRKENLVKKIAELEKWSVLSDKDFKKITDTLK